MTVTGRPAHILLVEDDEGQAILTRDAILEGRGHITLHHVSDGVEAMAYLRREGRYEDAPRPHLVLLDLNLPRKGGREVLAEIKQDEQLKHIPVVILSISNNDRDIAFAYRNQVNSFVTKPINLDEFRASMQTIIHYWFGVVQPSPEYSR